MRAGIPRCNRQMGPSAAPAAPSCGTDLGEAHAAAAATGGSLDHDWETNLIGHLRSALGWLNMQRLTSSGGTGIASALNSGHVRASCLRRLQQQQHQQYQHNGKRQRRVAPPNESRTCTASSLPLIRPSEPGTLGTPAACRGGLFWGSGHPCEHREARAPMQQPARMWHGQHAMRAASTPPQPILGLAQRSTSQQSTACLHCVARRGLVSHHADGVGLGADEFQAVVVADVHKRGVLGQEAVALQSRDGDEPAPVGHKAQGAPAALNRGGCICGAFVPERQPATAGLHTSSANTQQRQCHSSPAAAPGVEWSVTVATKQAEKGSRQAGAHRVDGIRAAGDGGGDDGGDGQVGLAGGSLADAHSLVRQLQGYAGRGRGNMVCVAYVQYASCCCASG